MTSCGNLHIRTPQTDSSLSPNVISQSITANGMRIGVIPETTSVSQYSYNVIIKNSSNVILYQSSSPILQSFYGDYVYVTIPLNSIPSIGESIEIKIISNDGCTSIVNFIISSYSIPTNQTTANVVGNGGIKKYIMITPTISDRGFTEKMSYFFECNSNMDTDDSCLNQFLTNTDLSKILNSLPSNSAGVTCPDTDEWIFLDAFCMSSGVTSTSSTSSSTSSTTTIIGGSSTTTSSTSSTTTKVPCSNGLTLDSITYISGSSYKVQFTSMDVSSISWKLYNTNNSEIKSGNSGALTSATFTVDFGTISDGNYTLKIKADNCSSSEASGTKTFVKGIPQSDGGTSTTTTSEPNTTGVTITEPNKSLGYYTETVAGLPKIYDSNTFPYLYKTEDIVWMTNDKIKVGINLGLGGIMTYLSEINSTTNLINNGYDAGRQIQPDYHVKPDNYKVEGKVARDIYVNFSYNTIMGGSTYQDRVALLDHKKLGNNSYYVKVRPIMWAFKTELSQCFIEATYTLIDRYVKVNYKYTSFRTDNQVQTNLTAPSGSSGFGMPSMFLNPDLKNFKSYTGNSAWTSGSLDSPSVPINSGVNGVSATEYWGAMVNDSDFGVGVYNKVFDTDNSTNIQFKQDEIYAGNPSGEFSNGYSFMQPTKTILVQNAGDFMTTDTAYIVVGTTTQIRNSVYTITGH